MNFACRQVRYLTRRYKHGVSYLTARTSFGIYFLPIFDPDGAVSSTYDIHPMGLSKRYA